jgi:hypothetical protein
VTAAASPVEAFRVVSRVDDPLARVVAARPVKHRPGGRVARVGSTADRVVVDVESPGGLLVVRRVYQPLYRARSAGAALATLPADLSLLGIEVPAGRHRVVIDVADLPETVAACIAGAALLAALLAGLPARTPPVCA